MEILREARSQRHRDREQMEQIEREMAPIIQRANEEAAKETIKSGALIVGTAYLGPVASVGSVATGSTISVLANGTYQ